MHRLQSLFATAEGEQQFGDSLRALFAATDLDAVEALLAAELATIDSEIAHLCRRLTREAVVLTGWQHLVEAIELHEGAPVTGVTLAIANELDLAFDNDRLHEPYVTVGLYTDEAYPFSSATPAELLAECQAAAGAAWVGREEDIELYLEAAGFGPLNTALLVHEQRHVFRDDGPAAAPMPYVDYVVGCWWRALRFEQAVAAELARHGLPGAIPVLAGMIDMRPDIASVHRAVAPAAPAAPRAEAAELGEISAADFIQRKPADEDSEPTGATLRRRFAGSAPEPVEPPAKPGLLRRLFKRQPPPEELAEQEEPAG